MAQSAYDYSDPARHEQASTRRNRRRREHLRHIRRMTHKQQMALIEEARAARSREQDQCR